MRAVIGRTIEQRETVVKETTRQFKNSQIIKRVIEIHRREVEVLECGHVAQLAGKPASHRKCFDCEQIEWEKENPGAGQ
jgi:hypothetical protein